MGQMQIGAVTYMLTMSRGLLCASIKNMVIPISGGCAEVKYLYSFCDKGEYIITVVNDLTNIPKDSYRYYSFNSNSGNTYHVSVGADSPIDILIMDQSNFNIYKNEFMSGSNGGVTYYAVQFISVTSEDFNYNPPGSGTYYVVIEKNALFDIGANAKTSGSGLVATKILLTGNS